MPLSVRLQYQEQVAAGRLRADESQQALAAALDALAADLAENARRSKRSSLGWLFARGSEPASPKGLYIWGEVGRGKTLLMDLFFKAAPTRAKRRVHFHAFMTEVHERIAEFRRKRKSGEASGDDPIPPVAAEIAAEARLLCFDEFHVVDIADAMILGRLFARLFEAAVTVVATSNTAPDQLYEGGLNRALFLPFVELLKEHMLVFQLVGPHDYRLESADPNSRYITPLGAGSEARLLRHFALLTGSEHAGPRELHNKGRTIVVPEAAGAVAAFTFADLCAKPFAAGDYLKIAEAFHTLLVSGVPVLGAHQRNEGKRLIILVDTLYDLRRRLVVSAAGEPEELFANLEGTESHESARAASRLIEMRSDAYWNSAGPAALARGSAASV